MCGGIPAITVYIYYHEGLYQCDISTVSLHDIGNAVVSSKRYTQYQRWGVYKSDSARTAHTLL